MNYSEFNRENRRLHLEMEEKYSSMDLGIKDYTFVRKPIREHIIAELFRWCAWFVIAILSLFILMPKGN